jgi:concentrative nucleoside transporter, CNT family
MPPRVMSAIGIGAIVGLCFLVSRDRRQINWYLVLWGLALQFGFALLLLKTYPQAIFAGAQSLFDGISRFSTDGARFLFGSLVEKQDFVMLSMAAVIIFVSSIMAVLNYIRVLPGVIYVLARGMQRTMRTSGAETLSAVMQIFMGIEAMTGLKPVIGCMTTSEIFTVMTCFMATLAGSVMAVYVGIFGANPGYILAASVMSAPAALAFSKMMIPETGTPETGSKVEWKFLLPADRGVVEAAANGAMDGLKLAAGIAAILLAFVSIIHMMNALLGTFGTSFEQLGGYVFAPVAYVLGVPWEDCQKAGNLLAVKTVFNEWLAYSRMKEMIAANELSPRAVMILTYALCSFANFGSMAILIGGLSALAPERREEIVSMALRSLFCGLLSGFSTAAVAGTLSNF